MARVAVIAALIAAVAAKPDLRTSYGSALEVKCRALNREGRAAFVGTSCFAVTPDKYKVKADDWLSLHSHCTHIADYPHHMAFIRTKAQLNALERSKLVRTSDAEEPDETKRFRYFIGARQTEVSKCDGGITCTSDTEEGKQKIAQNWRFQDGTGKDHGGVQMDNELWLVGEPNYKGSPPETAVSIEQLKGCQLGFNDVNPGESGDFNIICEYEDVITCGDVMADGTFYSLVGDRCFRASEPNDKRTYEDAKRQCNYEHGSLASIHDDEVNKYLAILAQETSNGTNLYPSERGVDGFLPHWIGLEHSNNEWKWHDNTMVDYFRWYGTYGLGKPVSFANSNNYAAALATSLAANDGESGFGHWTIHEKSKRYNYICVRPTEINNDIHN